MKETLDVITDALKLGLKDCDKVVRTAAMECCTVLKNMDEKRFEELLMSMPSQFRKASFQKLEWKDSDNDTSSAVTELKLKSTRSNPMIDRKNERKQSLPLQNEDTRLTKPIRPNLKPPSSPNVLRSPGKSMSSVKAQPIQSNKNALIRKSVSLNTINKEKTTNSTKKTREEMRPKTTGATKLRKPDLNTKVKSNPSSTKKATSDLKTGKKPEVSPRTRSASDRATTKESKSMNNTTTKTNEKKAKDSNKLSVATNTDKNTKEIPSKKKKKQKKYLP